MEGADITRFSTLRARAEFGCAAIGRISAAPNSPDEPAGERRHGEPSEQRHIGSPTQITSANFHLKTLSKARVFRHLLLLLRKS